MTVTGKVTDIFTFPTSPPDLPFGAYTMGVGEVVGMWYGCCNVVVEYGLSV